MLIKIWINLMKLVAKNVGFFFPSYQQCNTVNAQRQDLVICNRATKNCHQLSDGAWHPQRPTKLGEESKR